MKIKPILLITILGFVTLTAHAADEWITMFDGKSLDGWKSNEEKPGCFTVTDDGVLKVSGGRAHLFYVGKDGKWFEYTIRVEGKRVIIKVDGKVTVDWTESAENTSGRTLSGGTLAIQGHDPKSTVYLRNIRVKPQ